MNYRGTNLQEIAEGHTARYLITRYPSGSKSVSKKITTFFMEYLSTRNVKKAIKNSNIAYDLGYRLRRTMKH